MKSKIENVYQFISDKCDEKGNIKASNIDTKTKQGVKSLHDIVKKGELLVAPSDTLCNSVENNKIFLLLCLVIFAYILRLFTHICWHSMTRMFTAG